MSLQQRTVSNWIAVAAVLPITLCMLTLSRRWGSC